MGITIFYRGSLNDPSTLNQLMDEVADICAIMKWPYRLFDDDRTGPPRANTASSARGRGNAGDRGLKGIAFQPHKDSEWVDLSFDGSGRLLSSIATALVAQGGSLPKNSWNWVKTQFAPIDVHITIIKLLKHLKAAYIADLEVMDEGGYWESGDRQLLAKKNGTIFKAMDALERGLQDASDTTAHEKSADDLVARIEAIFRDITKKKTGTDDGAGIEP